MFIQFLTIIIVLYLLLRLGTQLKRKQITLKEALCWSLLWLGVALVVLYPKLTDRLAAQIGLQSAKGIDLVVYLAVGVVFYLVFRLFVRLEKMEQDITKIVRHVALDDRDKSARHPERSDSGVEGSHE